MPTKYDEMLERAFIWVYGKLTYAERRGQLSSVGRENDKYIGYENSPSSC